MRYTIATAAAIALASFGCSHDPTSAAVTADAPKTVSGATIGERIHNVPVDGLPSVGDPRALVTVVEFSDYECSYCRATAPIISKVLASYGGEVRLVVAQRPMRQHDRARPAALAALAAAEQGRFESMNARLLAGPLDDAAIARAAADIGLDRVRFEEDERGAAVQALDRSSALGKRIGVPGIPWLFINGRLVIGEASFDALRAVIDERLAAARALVASGVAAQDVYARTVAHGAEQVELDDSGC